MPEDTLGGAEQYLKKIATHYKDDNVYIYFFKNTNSKGWNDLKDQKHLYFLSTRNHLLGMLNFIRVIKKNSITFDYVFTSHVYCNSLVGILMSLGFIKANHFVARESTSIFLRYSGLKLAIYKLAYYFGYKNMDLLICQTDIMKSQLVKHFPAIQARTKVKVLANPIDLNDANQKGKMELEIDIQGDYIISAGRLIEEKGYDILIEAFSELRYDFQNIKLVILGMGPQREILEQLKETLNLEEDVILLGQVKNVYNYFRQAKMCVVSSRIEGFPNVLLQMMSQNSRVVSTLCAGGIEEIKGIYTCAPNEVSDLKNAMYLCLSDPKEVHPPFFTEYLKPREFENFIKTLNEYLT